MRPEDIMKQVEEVWAYQEKDGRPSKGLIRQLIEDESPETFTKIFLERTIWCWGYPIIHGFSSYNIFRDLYYDMGPALRRKLIPVALENALNLPDQYFHCAISVLASLIPDDQTSPRPPNFSRAFLILKKRAERLSFLPNLAGAWDHLALNQRYLIGDNDRLRKFYSNDLQLKNKWRGYFNSELKNTLEDGMTNCHVDVIDLEKKIKKMGCDPAKRELFYVTQIEQTRYWVWDLPAKEGTFNDRTIFALRQPNEGKLRLVSWSRYKKDERLKSPIPISNELMRIEYRIHDHLQVVKKRLSKLARDAVQHENNQEVRR